MLNMLAPELAPIVHAIFTQSLDTGELPRDWSLANVAPIFKKGNRVLAENYRPVSLTCITCKLFEHIVCRHILDHVEDHKILTNLQHGFCSGRSCETQLITTTHALIVKSYFGLDWRQCCNSLALCYFAVVMELPDSLLMNWKSEFGVLFLRCSPT